MGVPQRRSPDQRSVMIFGTVTVIGLMKAIVGTQDDLETIARGVVRLLLEGATQQLCFTGRHNPDDSFDIGSANRYRTMTADRCHRRLPAQTAGLVTWSPGAPSSCKIRTTSLLLLREGATQETS
jgi:hypothetical protein